MLACAQAIYLHGAQSMAQKTTNDKMILKHKDMVTKKHMRSILDTIIITNQIE